MTTETPEPCTTFSRRMRHYSTDLKPAEYGPGRAGRTLCREQAADQARVNGWESASPRKTPTVVADLPKCGRCVRVLACDGGAS